MAKSDVQLGMGQPITRRDFVHGAGLATLAAGLPPAALAEALSGDPASAGKHYPPTLTGLRGSHPGAFEAAHALSLEGKAFPEPRELDESYDLVVVGGGISGLSAAYFYRQRYGPAARILILENHDDFGGHAKRNEFHQGGQKRLAWGGTMNMEFANFSERVNALFDELGIDPSALARNLEFGFGDGPPGKPSLFFDAETFGRNVLVPGFGLDADLPSNAEAAIERFPLDEAARESLKRFYAAQADLLGDLDEQEREQFLHGQSYYDFLVNHAGLTQAAADLFLKTMDAYWGVSIHGLSVYEVLGTGMPGANWLGGMDTDFWGERSKEVAMFPDGNASIARLLTANLIPAVAPGADAASIAQADFDYAQLDRVRSPVRLRLSSTAIAVQGNEKGVNITYFQGGQTLRVKCRHAVLACWHSIIPDLCPGLPAKQNEAMRSLVKRPQLVTNVLLRNSQAMDRLGIVGADCPGRLHGAVWLVKGVNTGGYRHDWEDDGSAILQFWGTVQPPDYGVDIAEQHRQQRALMLAMAFEDYEREVRIVLDGMLGPAGFDVKKDILAITVNRWPHGYARDYLDLHDPDWSPGQAPHEIARKPFGRITFANADAGADAYTHVAIDQAWRAVSELPGGSR